MSTYFLFLNLENIIVFWYFWGIPYMAVRFSMHKLFGWTWWCDCRSTSDLIDHILCGPSWWMLSGFIDRLMRIDEDRKRRTNNL